MIDYVESNFILEIAYLQEQHESCEGLLALAEAGQLVLCVPAFSVTEVRLSLPRRAERRRKFHEQLKNEIRELSRSKPYNELSGTAEPLTLALVESAEWEQRGLDSILSRVLRICQILPTLGSTVQLAVAQEKTVNLSPGDAAVFAAILEDLAVRPKGDKCFLDRDKGFANPDINDELGKYECKLLLSFHDGLAYVRHSIDPKT